MPGPMLHLGATVTCSHGGQAFPVAPNPRVLVSGQPVVAQTSVWTVAGCGFVPLAGNGPCVTANYVVAATRVFVAGAPAVLLDSASVCAPTGTPLIPVQSQTRVVGS
ncbi:hypothetical protein [uncultured Tateyamaria sp.]|uniref:hypothetical protein n=1 Tax=uncultured Tateyamaria sp. TaxID=455651 RepID=UPI002606ADE8|nr:hypothetical protein [uncultured Tateyamaria sp.]